MKEEVSILVNISTSYIDIAEIFDELLLKFWEDCPYQVYYLCDAEPDINLKGKIIVDELNNNPLLRIVNAIKNINSDYYICLLGDAFISEKVSTYQVAEFVEKMKVNNINYCNLYRNKYKSNSTPFSFIKENEQYGFAFVEFIASKFFIENELNKYKTDLDFENYYNDIALTNKKGTYYSDCVRSNENILNVIHGIQNGKWVRKTKRKVDKISKFGNKNLRPIMGFKEECHNLLFEIGVKIKLYGLYRKKWRST